MSPDDLDELFASTLVGASDDNEPWQVIRKLHWSADHTIFEKAREWCTSSNPAKRGRAADILCQLRSASTLSPGTTRSVGQPIFVAESNALILQMIGAEAEEDPLRSELIGLGHLGSEEAISTLIRYITHPSADVRYAATWSLGSFPNHPQAIEALLQVCGDDDQDIRDYALFALGTQSDKDSPRLRELFVLGLNDTSEVVRQEALAGLAKRRDLRAVLPLFYLLEAGSYFTHHESTFEALLGMPAPEKGWKVDDLIEALYFRFPKLLPKRNDSPTPNTVP